MKLIKFKEYNFNDLTNTQRTLEEQRAVCHDIFVNPEMVTSVGPPFNMFATNIRIQGGGFLLIWGTVYEIATRLTGVDP